MNQLHCTYYGGHHGSIQIMSGFYPGRINPDWI